MLTEIVILKIFWKLQGRYSWYISLFKEKLYCTCFLGMFRTFLLKHLWKVQKQPFKGVLLKRCSENMQQIYRRTPMPKCDFNKVAKELYWNRTSAYVFSCKFAACFQNTFPKNTCKWLLLKVDADVCFSWS